jgi:hypothetical protein
MLVYHSSLDVRYCDASAFADLDVSRPALRQRRYRAVKVIQATIVPEEAGLVGEAGVDAPLFADIDKHL